MNPIMDLSNSPTFQSFVDLRKIVNAVTDFQKSSWYILNGRSEMDLRSAVGFIFDITMEDICNSHFM